MTRLACNFSISATQKMPHRSFQIMKGPNGWIVRGDYGDSGPFDDRLSAMSAAMTFGALCVIAGDAFSITLQTATNVVAFPSPPPARRMLKDILG